MTAIERRIHPRYSPDGLEATITFGPDEAAQSVTAEVVDISYDGVKVKLDGQIDAYYDGQIKIELFLPQSTIPLLINGIIKHINQSGELGLHYVDCPVVEALDSFMFECIKLTKNPKQKTNGDA